MDKCIPNNHSVLVTDFTEGLLFHLNMSLLLIEINGVPLLAFHNITLETLPLTYKDRPSLADGNVKQPTEQSIITRLPGRLNSHLAV